MTLTLQEKIRKLQNAAASKVSAIATDEAYLINGKSFTRVSAFLRETGLAYSPTPHPFRSIPVYLERGTAAHLACLLAEDGRLDRLQTDPEILELVDSYMKMLNDMGFHSILKEYTVFSDKYGLAGTIDRVGLLGRRIVLLDIKTGTVYPIGKLNRSYRAQVATYSLLFEEAFGFKINKCIVVNIAPSRYVIHDLSEGDLEQVKSAVLAAIKVWQWITQERSNGR